MTLTVKPEDLKELAVELLSLSKEDSHFLVVLYTDTRGIERWHAFAAGITLYCKPNEDNDEYFDFITGRALMSGTTFLLVARMKSAEIKTKEEVMDNFYYNNVDVETAKILTLNLNKSIR